MYNGHRANFHRVIYEFALSLGISIHLGKRVLSHHEDDKEMKAWITTDKGEIFKSDVVVGADGMRSRARKLDLGYDDKPKSSGYAVQSTPAITEAQFCSNPFGTAGFW